jgi:hypothetical protein
VVSSIWRRIRAVRASMSLFLPAPSAMVVVLVDRYLLRAAQHVDRDVLDLTPKSSEMTVPPRR